MVCALEEGLELLERCVWRYGRVLPPLALEGRHGCPDLVLGLGATRLDLLLQVRYGDVAEQRARGAVDDGQMRVLALKGLLQREPDWV